MINLKEVAETLLQIVNNEEQLKSVVELMKSTNNTVKDDIAKLREGAKLKPKFDLDRMFEYADDICNDLSRAQDYCIDAEEAALSARGCLDDIDYNADELRNIIENVKHELVEKDEVKNESNE
tara:strand:+ start:2299 stop:2667 length:369 start_codon:yes stop_codon:yes gene_type:complete